MGTTLDPLGEAIRALRYIHGGSQQAFSLLFQTSLNSVARWERGVQVPDAIHLKQLEQLAQKSGQPKLAEIFSMCAAGNPLQRQIIVARDEEQFHQLQTLQRILSGEMAYLRRFLDRALRAAEAAER